MTINLLEGDNCKWMDKMIEQGIKVDLVVTSPPYDNIRNYNGEGNIWDFEVFKQVANRLYKLINDGCVVVWVVADQTVKGGRTLTSFKQALYFKEIGFTVADDIIFSKNSPAFPPKRTSKRYGNIYEHMFILVKGKIRNDIELIADKPNKWAGLGSFGKSNYYDKNGNLVEGKKVDNIPDFSLRNNIWEYNVGCNKDKKFGRHPAVFPEKLAEDHIKSWSVEGDLVFDPFMGSGTTGKCACMLNRNFIGAEIVKDYYNISKKRIAGYFPDVEIIENKI